MFAFPPQHKLHASVPLARFVDVSELVSEVEEVEQVRKGVENQDSAVSFGHLDVKMSLILACASLAAFNLDAVKAQELGVALIDIDALARDLWRKAKTLITHLDSGSDSLSAGFEGRISALPTVLPSLANSYSDFKQTGSASTCASIPLLRVVAIKILLLLGTYF